jgi:hypothetical protein
MSIALFDDLDIGLIQLALYQKTGVRPRLSFGRLNKFTIQELFNLCTISRILSDQVYAKAVEGLSIYNPSLCEERLTIEQLDARKVFGSFTINEAWLLIYSLVKSDFNLACKLFRDASLTKQFKEKFSDKDLKKDDFYSAHNNIFLLLDSYQFRATLSDARILRDACRIKKSSFDFIVNSAILASTDINKRHKLARDISTSKAGLLRLGFAYTYRFFFGESYFKETVLFNTACNLMLLIIKSKPTLKMEIPCERRPSLPVTSSPTITPERRNAVFGYLTIVPDLKQPEEISPQSTASTSSDDESPRLKL